MNEDPEIRRRRARFRANHRGTKEMDWLLGRYADSQLAEMQDPMLADFELVLTVSDPELHAWLLEPELCQQATYRPLIDAIRAFHKIGDAA